MVWCLWGQIARCPILKHTCIPNLPANRNKGRPVAPYVGCVGGRIGRGVVLWPVDAVCI
jgi:hypothetical protein